MPDEYYIPDNDLPIVNELENEIYRLREIIFQMQYHIKHSKDCTHGHGFTYDFCPFVTPVKPPEADNGKD